MQAKKGEHPWGDAGQLVLITLFLAVWLVDSFILRADAVLGGPVHWGVRLGVLAAAFALAVVLFRSGHAALEGEQRPERVLRTGAFRRLRHPLYLASMLVYLGLAFSTLSLPALAVAALAFAFFNHIAAFEERVMEEKFGDEYREYRSQTGRWLPRFRK